MIHQKQTIFDENSVLTLGSIIKDSMKKFITLLFFCLLVPGTKAQNQKSFYDFKVANIFGDTVDLSKYRGTKVMVVNTASYCGYTPSFTQLEQLYEQYKSYNFTIIGFPCNDFGEQDPDNDSVINHFCTTNYNISFPMMSKIATVSQDTAPLYKWLQRKNLNGIKNASVAWNFNKFLIDEKGHWVEHYLSPVSPLDPAIISWIKSPTSINAEKINEKGELIQLISINKTSIDILIQIATPQYYNVKLYTNDGKLVNTIYDSLVNINQIISYSSSQLKAGVYLIKAQNKDELRTIKFILRE